MKFKFVSLNIWYGGMYFDKVLDFLKTQDADIVSLQEVYDSKDEQLGKQYQTIEIYKKELGYKYFDFAPSFVDTTKYGLIDIGNAVFSKFPITKTEVTFYDKPYQVVDIADVPNRPHIPRNLQHVVINLEGKEINIFNTHGVWGFDDKDNGLRLNMSKVIVEKVTGLPYVVLSGDFNVDQNTQAVANIEKVLKYVFKGERQTSFNTRIKTEPGFAKSVVDLMFVSNDLKILENDCPDLDISDHLPMTADLEII